MSNERVLLVEDNEQNMELVLYLLEEEGIDVRTAKNVEEFREALGEAPPLIVLLDMHLPGADGLTLLKELRERPPLMKVPVIALTAHAMRGDKERFLAAGCDGYISKPIDVKNFVSSVRSYFPALERG